MSLFSAIQAFLNEERDDSLDDIDIEYDPDCGVCEEDGFETCQGHLYSKSTDSYLPISLRDLQDWNE